MGIEEDKLKNKKLELLPGAQSENLEEKNKEALKEHLKEKPKIETRGRKPKVNEEKENSEVIKAIVEALNFILPENWKLTEKESDGIKAPITRLVMKYFPNFFIMGSDETILMSWIVVYFSTRIHLFKKESENLEDIKPDDKSDNREKRTGKNDTGSSKSK